MKNIGAFIVLIILTNLTYAQSRDETEVSKAVETLRKGMLDGDRKLLESITASELTYGHSSGVMEDKAAFVEALASGKSDFTKLELTNQTIKIVGNTSLVRHELHGEIGTGPIHLGVLLVWQKQKNEWKLLARQAFRL